MTPQILKIIKIDICSSCRWAEGDSSQLFFSYYSMTPKKSGSKTKKITHMCTYIPQPYVPSAPQLLLTLLPAITWPVSEDTKQSSGTSPVVSPFSTETHPSSYVLSIFIESPGSTFNSSSSVGSNGRRACISCPLKCLITT